MAAGWEVIKPLESLDPDRELDPALVKAVCDELTELNSEIRLDVVELLNAHKRGKYANGLRGGFKDESALFNDYFANQAFSWSIGTHVPPDALDAARSAVVLYLSFQLQAFLVDSLRAVPGATVVNARTAGNPRSFERTYRWVAARQLVGAIKGVQHDVEGFAGTVHDLLERPAERLRFVRTSYWPFDADVLGPLVLLGYGPGPSANVVNSIVLGSPMVAAGLVRSHLEAVLWRRDFEATMEEKAPVVADPWNEALAQHVAAGTLDQTWQNWITGLYGLLSDTLHSGHALTAGEIWAFRRLVKGLAEKLRA
jgi:hypothetical protein